jgi:SH3-like domain-containing protein
MTVDQREPASARKSPAWLSLLLVVVLLGAASPAPAQSGGVTDLPLPRFVSLRADEVNLRSGPGTRYPIEWTYIRRGLPVEITAEYDNWRRIREFDGTTGWVHRSLLSGQRTVLVAGDTRALYDEPDPASRAVLRAEPGVLGTLLSCAGAWCRIAIGDVRAFIPRAHIWGVYADEEIH